MLQNIGFNPAQKQVSFNGTHLFEIVESLHGKKEAGKLIEKDLQNSNEKGEIKLQEFRYNPEINSGYIKVDDSSDDDLMAYLAMGAMMYHGIAVRSQIAEKIPGVK